MNRRWFGDSYEIVKRFFVDTLRSEGYSVFIDPMFTGEWEGIKEDFYNFVGVRPISDYRGEKSALLVDPDTGIGKRKTKQHVTIEGIAKHLETFDLVFSFDQSFSRSKNPLDQMSEKLNRLRSTGNYGFYYDSHARFLFASGKLKLLNEFKEGLKKTGLPPKRIVEG